MTDETQQYAENDYYQFYADYWGSNRKGIDFSECGVIFSSAAINVRRGLEDLVNILETTKNIAWLISAEVSKDDKGKKGQRIHYQGVIVSGYAQRKNSKEKLDAFFKGKELIGKTNDYGFMKGKMDKPLISSMNYIMKDQKPSKNDIFMFKGFTKEFIDERKNQWIEKEYFQVERKVKKTLCEKCQSELPKEKTYTQKLVDYVYNELNNKEITKYQVMTLLVRKVGQDKASLNKASIKSTAQFLFLKLGLESEQDYINGLLNEM